MITKFFETGNSLRFSGHFPGGSGLADIRTSPFLILLGLMMMEVVVTTGAVWRAKLLSDTTNKPTPNVLQAGRPSCHPTNSVRALKGD